jgi:hypothetical protein
MIVKCRNCERDFWRYRRDHPPRGFCSQPCHDMYVFPEPERAPQTPQQVMLAIRRHRRDAHGVDSALPYFDCAVCDELEGLYAGALGHYLEHPEFPIGLDGPGQQVLLTEASA